MGEAKRRRDAGELDMWYHGTDEHFDSWGVPPVQARYKHELPPHSFLSLTMDRALAEGAGELGGGLCSARISATAKVLDLRASSPESMRCWTAIAATAIGRSHPSIATYSDWVASCKSGEVLRAHTSDPVAGSRWSRLIDIARDERNPLPERAAASLEVQLYTREWIETVISTAASGTFQAVICNEVDRYRPGGKRACTNLYVFDPSVLEPPRWLTMPDEAKAIAALQRINAMLGR